ncbi:MAG: hypothetical protein ABWX61_10635 [Paenisporosarcina sp.]
MNLIQWSYTKKYQIKAIFNEFPDTIFIFRSIGSYYFIYTTKGILSEVGPTRHDYVKMELLLNLELNSLPAYLNRKNQKDMTLINLWLQKKELPDSILEVLSNTK